MEQKKIGAFISQLRKEKKLTQEKLAERLDTSNRSISRWENGATMPDLPMMYRLSEALDVTIGELLNGERISSDSEKDGDKGEGIGLVIELSEQEKLRKAKKLNRYFLSGLVCILLAALHERFHILGFIRPQNMQNVFAGGCMILGVLLQLTGLYLNGKGRTMTMKEAQAYANEKKTISMKTAEEMLQFARRNQTAEFRQYEKGFAEIAKELLPEESVRFSMVADDYTVNEGSGGFWHLSIAVTEKRLLIGGEKITGRLFTRYGADIYELSEILSVAMDGKKIILNTKKREIKLGGENFPQIFEQFKSAVKKP